MREGRGGGRPEDVCNIIKINLYLMLFNDFPNPCLFMSALMERSARSNGPKQPRAFIKINQNENHIESNSTHIDPILQLQSHRWIIYGWLGINSYGKSISVWPMGQIYTYIIRDRYYIKRRSGHWTVCAAPLTYSIPKLNESFHQLIWHE